MLTPYVSSVLVFSLACPLTTNGTSILVQLMHYLRLRAHGTSFAGNLAKVILDLDKNFDEIFFLRTFRIILTSFVSLHRGRLVALWMCYFQGLGFSMSLTIVSSNVAGYTKKQLTGAALFTGYCVGNIIGPQTFKASEKPGYKSAYIA